MGGEKLLVGLRGAKKFAIAFRIVFRILSRFSNRFSYRFKNFSGANSFCTRAALTFPEVFYAEALFRTLLRPFAFFGALLRTRVCALLRSFAFFCAQLRVAASDCVQYDRVWELQTTWHWRIIRSYIPKVEVQILQ